jgi:photosystem II stability/assembly factor-like uncharacterized protein
MKKVFVLLFALIAIKSANAQWFTLNLGTNAFLNSVYFTDENTGFAAGGFNNSPDGVILKTTDGGINWTVQNFGYSIKSVYFPNDNTGFATGEIWDEYGCPQVIVLKTTDGGENWISQYTTDSIVINSIHFPDENNGYVVGYFHYGGTLVSGIVLKTIDGGNNWTNLIFDIHNFTDVYFTGLNTGFIAGTMFYAGISEIFKTTNGGLDWTSKITLENGRIQSIFFIDEYVGYIGGFNVNGEGILYKTINGGEDWIDISLGSPEWIFSIYFTSENIGYATGWGGEIDKTTDGGESWTNQYFGSNAFYSVFFTNENVGYVVGSYGTILKTTNGGSTGLNENFIFSEILKIYPNPSKDKITISSPSITKDTKLSIFNVNGEKVIERLLTDNETQLDISTLPRGVYFVKVQNETMVGVGKMVKE